MARVDVHVVFRGKGLKVTGNRRIKPASRPNLPPERRIGQDSGRLLRASGRKLDLLLARIGRGIGFKPSGRSGNVLAPLPEPVLLMLGSPVQFRPRPCAIAEGHEVDRLVEAGEHPILPATVVVEGPVVGHHRQSPFSAASKDGRSVVRRHRILGRVEHGDRPIPVVRHVEGAAGQQLPQQLGSVLLRGQLCGFLDRCAILACRERDLVVAQHVLGRSASGGTGAREGRRGNLPELHGNHPTSRC